MKKLTLLITILAFNIPSTQAQDWISERDIVGTWKMVIELDEAMEKLEEEADESESIFAKALLASVSGIIENVMDNIQIYIDFDRNGDASILIEAFDDTDGDQDTNWYIRNNRVYIENTDNFNSDGDNYWVMKDGVLYLEDDNRYNDAVIYLVRVDD